MTIVDDRARPRPPGGASPPRPLVGALLRGPWQAVRNRVLHSLHAAGFDDLTLAHWPVFQYPTPLGRRPIDIAAGAQMSKQAMNRLLRELEERGYIEMRDNPATGTRGVYPTERGERVIAGMRRELMRIEDEWSRALGPGRYRALRQGLEALNARLSTPPASPHAPSAGGDVAQRAAPGARPRAMPRRHGAP